MKKLFFILVTCTVANSFAQRGNTIPKTAPASNPAPVKVKTAPKPVSTNSSGTIKLTVLPETAPCNNNPSTKCLQIKKQGNLPPETIEDIENFNYEIGYIYTVLVKEIPNTSPVTGGESAYRYIWVKTLSKTEAESAYQSGTNQDVILPEVSPKPTYTNGKTIVQTTIQTSSSLDGKWYLRKLKETEGSSFVTDDNIMWIEINTFKDRIDGFGACNKFATVVKSDLKTTFEISKLTSNYAICGNKKIEDLFYNLLEQTDRFEIKNGRLILSKQWKYLLEFVADPNNKEDILSTYTPPTIVENKEMIYATNEKITGNNPVNAQNTAKSSQPTESQTANSNTTANTNSKNDEVDELQKQIELLKIQVEEKKQKELEEKKKIEEEKLQKQKIAEAERIEQEKIEKQYLAAKEKEKQQMEQQQLLEQEKQIKQKEISKNIQLQPVNTTESNKTTYTTSQDNSIPEPLKEKMVYILNNSKLEPIEKGRMMANSEGEKLSLSVFNNESTTHFNSSSIPRFIIKMPDNSIYGEYISLFKANVKGDERIVNVRPAKNRIEINVIKVKQGVYEINIPKDISSGEYVFLFPKTMDIACFGISK